MGFLKGQNIFIILNNFIPLFGVLFMGWKIPPVLFFFWFDSEMAILELSGLVMSEVSKEGKGLFPKKIKGIKKLFYTVVSYLIFSLILSIPAFLAGVILYNLLQNNFKNPLKEIFMEREVWFGLAINIIFRGYNILTSIKGESQKDIKKEAEGKYILLAYKFFGIWILGNLFKGSINYFYLYLYIFLISIFFSFSEIMPQTFLNLITKSKKNLKN